MGNDGLRNAPKIRAIKVPTRYYVTKKAHEKVKERLKIERNHRLRLQFLLDQAKSIISLLAACKYSAKQNEEWLKEMKKKRRILKKFL